MSRRRWLSLCHHLVLLVALVSLLTLLVPVSRVTAEDPVVVFADPYLESAIRGQIWPPNYDGPIHQSEITPIRGVGVTDRGVVSLSELEHCINLEGVDFSGNQISDLSPLTNLTHIAGVRLVGNQISDISPLAGLTNLQVLRLDDNQISNISSLSGLTNLRELSLNTNQIGDIEPLVNNPGIDAGDWIDLRSNPLSSESINTWIPALLARGVGVAWDQNPPPPASTIAGYVEDGYDHNLGGVEVTLIDVSSGSQTTEAVAITDDEGEYSFGGIDTGDYQIEIALECHRTAGDTAIFSVNYDTAGPVVSAQTPSFQHTAGESTTRDISFADTDLVPAAGITQGRLDDLAGMYYHVKQVVDFNRSELGVTLDLNLPIEVHGYSSSEPGRAYYSGNDGNIYIGADRSDYGVRTKPWTPDWHEMFHELMDDTVGIPPRHTGDEYHHGYANHCTGDSWVEGWAEFWPCALARSLDIPEWRLFWGTTSLEQNWVVWDRSGGYRREEFAAASLLVDLVDPVNPPEYDFLSLTDSQLWAIIGSKHLANMFEVYSALVAAKVPRPHRLLACPAGRSGHAGV